MSPSTAPSTRGSRTVTDARSGVTTPRSAPRPTSGHTGPDPGKRARAPFTRDERRILAVGAALAICSAALLLGAIRTAFG